MEIYGGEIDAKVAEVKRKEVRDKIAFKLFKYHYLDVYQRVVSGFNWGNDYGWAKAKYYRRADEIISDLSSLGVMLVDKEAELPGHIPCRGLNPEVTLEQYQSLLHDIFRFLTVEDSYVKAYPLEEK